MNLLKKTSWNRALRPADTGERVTLAPISSSWQSKRSLDGLASLYRTIPARHWPEFHQPKIEEAGEG